MKKTALMMLTLMVLTVAAENGRRVYSMYTNHTAMRVDDLLTVLIVESAKAGSKSGTNTDKKSSYNLSASAGAGALRFLPSMGASAGVNVNHDGNAGTSREGSLDARLSARVVKVLDNGNLVIEGSKVVEINEEKEIIKISGIVRPMDIESNNIVYSHNIADAQITYSGKGNGTNAQRPGLLTKFLNWVF